MSHRVLYQLAVKLSRRGIHVLRFDYYGCGDSAGDFEQGSLGQWVRDIHRASIELARQSNLSLISVLGLRLGATLALMAASQSDHFSSLILWQPILEGPRYLKELSDIQKKFSKRIKGNKRSVSGNTQEVLGFPLTAELKQDLKEISANRVSLRQGSRLLAIVNKTDVSYDKDLHKFLHENPQAESEIINDYQIWQEELYKRLIPITTISFILNWIEKAHP